MTIRPIDVHTNQEQARFGVIKAAEELGIKCNLMSSSVWIVKVSDDELQTFLELAREAANATQ